ncbi:hypothetical protein Clacol_007185 [Clathrus columnatus]|uniref:Alpha/beta hydrolase fold-3 domain-containing protein n=1 Tax=Clathrus columnatus TaxID=1419009 RepID=A0AAV5AIJ8_9AGAM|nr:hypothetical protein Clacol_007185 [Clathrus columnatus]
MAQYASLSEPDPEWLKLGPIPSLYTTDIVEFRNTWNAMCDSANSQVEIDDCFCLGSLNDNDKMLRSLAEDLRITCVSVDYRKAPETPFPASLDDDYAGLKWALANAKNISLDISKGVLIGGLSAGGNLSAVIAQKSLRDDEIRGKITGQLLISPFLLYHTAYPDRWKSELLSKKQNEDAMILPDKALELYTDLCNVRRSMIGAYLGDKPENAFNPDFSPLLAHSFEGLPPAYIQIAGCDPLRDEAFYTANFLKRLV